MNGEVTRPSPNESSPLRFVSIAIIVAYVFWLSYWFRAWNFEDGFIGFRIVRNLFEQVGWSYNVGERLNATPSPLYTIFTLLASKVTILFYGDPEIAIPMAGHAVCGLSTLVASLCVFHLFSREGHSILGTACSIHIAYALTTSGVWGTEIPLLAALFSLFVTVQAREASRGQWLLLGLAFITSFDSVSVILAKSLVQTWRNGLLRLRRIRQFMLRVIRKSSFDPNAGLEPPAPRLRNAFVPLFIPILPWFTFSLVLFDQLFPDILVAKMWQGRSGFWGTGPIYFNALINYLQPTSLGQAMWLFCSAAGWLFALGYRHRAVYILIFVVSQQLIFSALNIPANHSHFVWIELAQVIGIWVLAVTFTRPILQCGLRSGSVTYLRFEKFGPAVVLCALVILLMYTVAVSTGPLPMEDRQISYRRAAIAVEDDIRFPPGPLAALETGTLGFYSRRQMLDLTGLTSRNTQFIDGKHNDQFFEISPAAIVLHNPPLRQEESIAADPRFSFLYDKVVSLTTAPIPLELFARTKRSAPEVKEEITASVKGFDPILMVNPVASPQAQCRIDFINGERMVGRTLFRTNSPLLDIRGWAIRKDVEIDPKEDVRIILIGDLGKAFAVYSPRHQLTDSRITGKPDIFRHAGFSIVTHLYAVPRGRYGVMIWQQGMLCGPAIGILYE